MQVDVYDTSGTVVGQTDLDGAVWGIEPHIAVMHQAMLRQQANARLGTHDTRTRGEVRGGGRKPWRQKGTGRARQGSIRSPQWKGGGVVWGPHPRKYTQRLPRKMRQLAVRSALSAKVRDNRLTVMRDLAGIEPRTKTMKAIVEGLPVSRSVLIAVPTKESAEAVYRASGNLQHVWVVMAAHLNVRDLLKFDRLVVMEEAIEVIEAQLAPAADRREPGVFRKARLERLVERQRAAFGRVAAREKQLAASAEEEAA